MSELSDTSKTGSGSGCACHPEEDKLLTKLGGCKTLKISEMVQRTIDHAIQVLTVQELDPADDETITEQDISISVWKQEVWDPDAKKNGDMVPKIFVVVGYPYNDQERDFFISIDGCEPKQITHPGPLFFSALNAQQLSGDLNNKEYWNAVMIEEF